ncbi:MAG TPA: heat-inducible transcriptional repressor HrcA [Blastocatellia bacterium]|nr:heat-inducible transcriptional repressor HrcA [Blastocatellia bacterium]
MRQYTDILDERSREMLALLVETHVSTGEPVGSRTISKLSKEGLSAATVRNVMSDLEGAGYLEQPHTSAGRIPTSKCYRFYVDHIIETTRLSEADEAVIRRWMLGQEWNSPERLMARVSHLLSQLSDNVGIVVAPSLAQDVIKHIEFMRLNDGRILVITVSRTGLVQNRLVRVEDDLTQEELDRTARYVNANFSGMTLSSIRTELLRQMSEEKALYDRLLQNASKIWERGFSPSEDSEAELDTDVFVEGASNIVTKPDFADVELISSLFRIFEEKSRLVRILNECLADHSIPPVRVRIGGENSLPELRGCTVITSTWNYGDQVLGSLAVVGPMRMHYARMINVVNYVARLMERVLSGAPESALN